MVPVVSTMNGAAACPGAREGAAAAELCFPAGMTIYLCPSPQSAANKAEGRMRECDGGATLLQPSREAKSNGALVPASDPPLRLKRLRNRHTLRHESTSGALSASVGVATSI